MSQYQVVKNLGQGMNGTVLLAQDRNLMELVCLKIPISSTRQQQHANCDAMYREIRALRRVKHRHVIQLKRILRDSSSNLPMAATEYAEGGDFYEIISQTGQLSESLASHYFRQLMQALNACHSRNVYHSDVKLENMLLDSNYKLKLCDFGSAIVAASADEYLVDSHGTEGSMAPEALSLTGHLGAPADIWSAAVALFIMLTGHPPFTSAASDDYWFHQLETGNFADFCVSHNLDVVLSNEAIDLLAQVFRVAPEERLTIREILNHPWLRAHESLAHEHVQYEMAQRVRKVKYIS